MYHVNEIFDELNNGRKLGGVGWLSRVVFSFIIGAPNQRLVNTLTDHRETDEQPGAEAHCNKSGQRGREVKGAQSRLHGLKSLAKRFNLVVFQSSPS